ncbi:MAG: hypothetical protein HY080_04395 [Gammaproteobacteria bacterium]|nr:hypothetical protein [Gammaproteobacteria bacterium]
MRYISILFSLALVAGFVIWYMKSAGITTVTTTPGTQTAPQQAVRQAQDTATSLQQTLEQQQKQLDQNK